MTDSTVTFTAEKVKALRQAYNKAVAAEQEQFMFEGGEYVTTYAKYLLEYLECKLKGAK